MIEGQTIELKSTNGIASAIRAIEIDKWAEALEINEYIATTRTCVRISKDEYVTLFTLKFADYIG